MRRYSLAAIIIIIIFTPGESLAQQIDFATAFYSFNNADFLKYNENDYVENKAVPDLNTDDETSFAYSTISLRLDRKYKKTEFHIHLYRSGFWGSDNLEGRDEGGNDFLFRRLYFSWYPVKYLSIDFGRQFYSIGGMEKDYFFFDKRPLSKDYFFSDIIDGIRIKYRFGESVHFTLMADIMDIASKPEESYVWSNIEKDEETVDDFQGKTWSYRGGFLVQYHIIKVFSFGVKYGANTQGGADKSESGNNQLNEPDGDYLSLSGARLFYKSDIFNADWTFAYSYGKDYQYLSTNTYNGFGAAINASLGFKNLFTAAISLGYFQPDFCGMKAQSMGGLLMWAYKGYFVSPHASFYHFRDHGKDEDMPTYVDRTNSKTFGKLEERINFSGFEFIITGMALLETEENTTWNYMGSEFEFSIDKKIDNLKFSLITAVYFPSDYYKERRVDNTFIPAGSDPFYGGGFIVTYLLDLQDK